MCLPISPPRYIMTMDRTRTCKEFTSVGFPDEFLFYTNDLRRQRDSNPQAVLPTNCFQDSPTTIITYLQVVAESIGIEPNPGLTERNAQQAPAITIKRYSPNRFLQVAISHSATQAYKPREGFEPPVPFFRIIRDTIESLYFVVPICQRTQNTLLSYHQTTMPFLMCFRWGRTTIYRASQSVGDSNPYEQVENLSS